MQLHAFITMIKVFAVQSLDVFIKLISKLTDETLKLEEFSPCSCCILNLQELQKDQPLSFLEGVSITVKVRYIKPL